MNYLPKFLQIYTLWFIFYHLSEYLLRVWTWQWQLASLSWRDWISSRFSSRMWKGHVSLLSLNRKQWLSLRYWRAARRDRSAIWWAWGWNAFSYCDRSVCFSGIKSQGKQKIHVIEIERLWHNITAASQGAWTMTISSNFCQGSAIPRVLFYFIMYFILFTYLVYSIYIFIYLSFCFSNIYLLIILPINSVFPSQL